MSHVIKKSDPSSSQSIWSRFAHVTSEIANPLYVAFPTLLIISLSSAPDVPHGLLWWIIAVLGISIAPFLFVLRGVRRGRYSDHHVSVREQRLVPLLFGVTSVIIAFVLLLLLHASTALLATLTAVIVVLLIATVITKFWKISLHLVGAAGAVTALVLLFGPLCFLLLPLVVLVGWARWYVQAHTILQAIAGTALATSVTIIIFRLFQVH